MGTDSWRRVKLPSLGEATAQVMPSDDDWVAKAGSAETSSIAALPAFAFAVHLLFIGILGGNRRRA